MTPSLDLHVLAKKMARYLNGLEDGDEIPAPRDELEKVFPLSETIETEADYILAQLERVQKDTWEHAIKIVGHRLSYDSGTPSTINKRAYTELCERAGVDTATPLEKILRADASQQKEG